MEAEAVLPLLELASKAACALAVLCFTAAGIMASRISPPELKRRIYEMEHPPEPEPKPQKRKIVTQMVGSTRQKTLEDLLKPPESPHCAWSTSEGEEHEETDRKHCVGD